MLGALLIYLLGCGVTFATARAILCRDNKEIRGAYAITEDDHTILAVMTALSWFGLACVAVGELLKKMEQ